MREGEIENEWGRGKRERERERERENEPQAGSSLLAHGSNSQTVRS